MSMGHAIKVHGGMEVWPYSFILEIDVSGRLHAQAALNPEGETPTRIQQASGWISEPVSEFSEE